MLIHFKQIAFKLTLGLLLFGASAYALNVPLVKVVSINIPKSNYSVVEFPFKIKAIQINSFVAKVKKNINNLNNVNKAIVNKNKKPLNFQKSKLPNAASARPIVRRTNYLNMTKGVNVLTFKPSAYGYSQMIIWGYKPYPIILTIHVVKKSKAFQYFKFVPTIAKSSTIQAFESMPHEKIIASIVKYLYAKNVNPKPAGYYDAVVRKDYMVNIRSNNKIIGKLVSKLQWETIGRNYIGQVWTVNIKPNKNYKKPISVRLYAKMFASKGIYAVSINRYVITRKRGTEVMIVRYNDNHIGGNQGVSNVTN